MANSRTEATDLREYIHSRFSSFKKSHHVQSPGGFRLKSSARIRLIRAANVKRAVARRLDPARQAIDDIRDVAVRSISALQAAGARVRRLARVVVPSGNVEGAGSADRESARSLCCSC